MTMPLGQTTIRGLAHGIAVFTGLFMGIRDVVAAIILGKPSLAPLQSLPAFLDTLLPEDQSPSATQMGVDCRLLALTTGRRERRLLLKGCLWLDRRAMDRYGRTFMALDDSGREAIVAEAATAGPGSLPRAFFTVFRAEAFHLYYASEHLPACSALLLP